MFLSLPFLGANDSRSSVEAGGSSPPQHWLEMGNGGREISPASVVMNSDSVLTVKHTSPLNLLSHSHTSTRTFSFTEDRVLSWSNLSHGGLRCE